MKSNSDNSSFIEKRAAKRVHNTFRLWCAPYDPDSSWGKDRSQTFQSTCANISSTGVLFDAPIPYAKNSMLKLEIEVPGWEKFHNGYYKPYKASGSDPIRLIASVARAELGYMDSIYRIGAHFISIDENQRSALNDLFNDMK